MADYPRIDEVDHGLAMDPDEVPPRAEKKLQKRLRKLENVMYQKRVPLVIMYEGWDAAGKGSNIKRVAQALDARAYTIFPPRAYQTRAHAPASVALLDAARRRAMWGSTIVRGTGACWWSAWGGLATHEQWSRATD